ncbi:hypothetical protein LAZ67_8001650, partial [Cordylochernes scorpioides]
MSLEATNLVWAGSPHRAEHEPARLGSESEAVADLSAENHFQGEDSRMADASANYANLPIDRSHANFAAACIADITPSTSGALAAATNWAEQMEAAESGEDSFTVVKHKRRRRESPNRPVEQRSSGVAASRRTGATPRRRPTAGGATMVQEIRATRADIADARVQQRSSTEDNCVFVEHCPDFGYTHYLQAVEELVGGAGNVLQVMKMDGHMLVGLSTKALAERLLRDGLEIGHTHLRAFPFKKRAERITVANLPFFVDDAAVIEALRPYGDVTSIVPIRLRAGRYTFTDGRREAPEGPVGPRPAGSQHPEPPPARPDLVAPSGPLPAQKTLGPAAPTPDVEMSIVEETLASSTSSAKNATRVDLDAFIEGHPSVSFAETDALGLGRIIRKSRFAKRNSNCFEKKSKLCKSLRRQPGCKFCRPGQPLSLAAIPTSNAAAQVRRNWADITEEVNPGAEEGFTLVQGRKRRRGSVNSPTAAAPSSNPGGSRTIRRPQPSAGSVPRAQEIRVTRAHIAEARARQASSSGEHCVYIEHSPELEPFHYLRALDRMLGGTAGVIQITKVNGHQLLGLTNRGLAERLISEGLEVEGTLRRAFPFRKRAERITVGNVPFFIGDSAVINALSPYGRVTSIAPKQMKAGPYVYVDGRRDVFITLHEGITIERLPTRLDINIKGEAWPAYLSSGIRCSWCHGQGHRRAICPLLAGLANNTRMAPPTTPAGVPPPTTPAPPQRSVAQPSAPTPSNPAMEVCSAPPVARAVLHSSAPRPSPPAAPAFPMEETPSAPPPVTPAPSLQAPEGPVGPRPANPQHPEPPPARPDLVAPRDPLPAQNTFGPAAPTPDVEMSIVEETSASSTSSARNATRIDLDAFIERHPSVSFAETDALGLGREEVLYLLSSRTKAQRNGPLLPSPQCDALARLIMQILDLRPGAASNLYKVLIQVKAELRTTPAAVPTPTPPAPRPAETTSPALHGERTSPDIATPPPPLSTQFIDACYDQAGDIIYALSRERFSEPLSNIGVTEGDIVEAIIFPEDREPLFRRLSTQKRTTLAEIISAASECALNSDPFVREGLRILSEMLPPPLIYRAASALKVKPLRRYPRKAILKMRIREQLMQAPALQICQSTKGMQILPRRVSLTSRHQRAAPWPLRQTGPSKWRLQNQKTLGPAAPTPDVEMSIVEETSASSTSSAKNATRFDLDAFIERHPTVSFPGTDALGLGREEVLDLLSSRTKAQRNGPLLSPPQCDALAGLIRQILDLRPGAASNLYKVLGQVKAELRTTPAAVPPTPPLPAPRPAEPMLPTTHREELTPPPPAPTDMEEDDPMTEKERGTPPPPAPRPAEPTSPALHMSTHVYLGQVKAELRTTPAVPPTPPLPAPRPFGPTPPTSHSEELMPAVMTPPPPALTEMEEDNPITEKERCVPPPPAPRLAEPTPPAPHREEVTPAMATPPPPLPFLLQVELESKCEHQTRDLLEELDFQRALRPLIRKGLDLQGLSTAIMWLEINKIVYCHCHMSTYGTGHDNPGGHAEFDIARELGICLTRAWKAQHPISTGGRISSENGNENIISKENSENRVYANPPTGVRNANLAAARGDVTTGSAAATSSNGAARVLGNWADYTEDQGPGEDDEFTVVKNKKRRRESPGSPAAAAPSSGTRGAGATRRPRSSTGWAPRAEEVRTTRAHIAEARARQASSTEDHCVFVERSPELEPYHYMRTIDRKFGSTREVFQVTKMNGHFLVGLANKSMAERLVNEGLEVEGTLHRAFPFRKRAERITVDNLPFFVGDAAVISALSPFGRVTSIAPKLMKAGPYVYNDGRREAFINLREGMTIERLPTRLNISIKGEAWPAYLSSGIRCSRCRGQGHRRANCPMLAGRTTAPGPATPTSPTSVPPATAPRLPQQPSARPPPPASPSSTMEVSDVPPASRAAPLPPAALQPSPPAPSALPLEDAPPAPPPVTPAPSLRTPGSREPAAPTPDEEMSIAEETSAFSTSSAKNATRVDLDAFIEKHPSVSFAGTDALGLGREEVLDLLSSRTKAQRKGPLLSPPQCDALAGLIRQILDLRPGAASNLYKVLGQVKAELRTTPAAVPPTPPLPAPRPAEPMLPTTHREELTPPSMTPPPPAPTDMEEDNPMTEEALPAPRPAKPAPPAPHKEDSFTAMITPPPPLPALMKQKDLMPDIDTIFNEMIVEPGSRPMLESGIDLDDVMFAVLYPEEYHLEIPSEKRNILAGFLDAAIGRKRRRGSGNSPTTAAPSSNAGASRTIRRPQSSAGSVPRAQEIRATRAHIADARARQASSSEEHCVYIEHSPELEPFHYLRALDRKLGGTAGVIQITKVNGHQLLGLTNRGLAERLISEGLEVEGTLLRAFPFRKRAERITVGNLPFFVADSAVITALSPYGWVTSIAPKQMKAGPYVYVDGRRDVFITLHEGITIERLPTRLDINIKGQAWPAYLSSGIRCSRCHGHGYRRPICPLLAGLANNTRMAPPTTPAGVPPPTTSAPPQRSAAQPPAPAPSNLAMEVCSAPPMARAVLHPSAPRPSPPAAPALPMEETPSAPPPVIPAPSRRRLRVPWALARPIHNIQSRLPLGRTSLPRVTLCPPRRPSDLRPQHRTWRCPSWRRPLRSPLSRMATNMVWAESPSKAEEKPVRLGSKAQPSAEITAKNVLQTNSSINSKENHNYVNPPAGSQDANSASPVDLSLAAIPTSNAAAQVRRNWADITEEVNPGAEEGFTLVQGRKRRRGSANSPTAAAPSSNAGGSRTIRRPQPSAGSVPRAQEIRVTRAHIAEARARQASSSEEHCVYIEHSPELEPFHYLRALDRMLGGTAGVIQITKVNGHQLLGLTNRGLAERLISEGLEVEGTLLRAFPFRKRAERITVGNLPFFIGDSAVINALSPYGRVTSIAPKQMKAGPYVYVDGRRDVFITLHEGITIERLPTRLDINIKGEAWPAYLSSGIRCSRCHGQGHRRAICPLLAGLANNTRMAPPTTPAGVSPPTTPAPPQRSAAQPPAPTPSNPAMEVCSAPPVARAALHSSAPRPSPPAAPAFPMEETPPAPPPVTPAPSLRTPGSREPAAPTPDVEMSIVEETSAFSTSLSKNATRVDLDAFIERHPSTNSSINSKENHNYVNPPAGSQDANSASPVDLSLAAIPTSNAAAQVRRNWADITEEVNPGAEEGFTLVQGRKRRRGSANSPTAAAPSSNAGGSRTIRRPQPSAGSVPRAQEIRVTRAHIAEARARQASSSEEHCVYIEHSPELEPFHYLRALDRMLGGTAGVIQITKVNGHQLLGLTNRGLAERLISEGLEVEGTLLRAFPFRKRAERITVGNLPFFIGDSAVINALSPYGRVTSIAPKQMKAGPYVYVDGRRDVFITLHEGITIERLPTRLDINIKGEAWPAYLSSGIRCSRCHGQGHRRAICPLLAGLANNTRMAPPTTPAGVSPPTTPAPPQRSAAQPPAPTPSNPAMEVCSAPPVARAALHSSAPRPSPPAAPAFPMEETPPAPPPVTPAPSLRTPGSREPAAPTPDVEMSIVEETLASFTSSAKNATRVDLDAFIEGHPSVSFAKTDALGLGREEVLDLLSSRTKAQRKGPLLSPPQCDALAGLIGQILDLRPGAASNLYKVLGQVKAELRTTPAVPPTPTLPAPWPSKPTPPALHGEKTSPDIATPPPPLSTEFIDACYDQANDIIYELSDERYSEPLSDIGVTEGDIVEAIIFPDDREPLLRRLSTQKRTTLAGIVSAASERARSSDPFNKCSIYLRTIENHANSPAGGKDANSATSFDFAIDTPFNGAIKAQRSWTDSSKDVNPASGDGFAVVHGKKRRRDSAESPVTAAHSSNASRSGFYRRQRSSTERVPRAQEIKTTRTHIVEARARQASSTKEQCLYVEHCPEFETYHYLKAIDEMVEGTSDVVQDASVIDALSPYGRVTSIVPKQLKAGKYVYTDGRREAFIVPHDGMTIESIPARLDIRIKGEAWPMYLTSGIRCSRCRGQGHRRANCPLLTGQFTGPRRASPSSTTNVPQVTAPELPRQASAASPAPPPPDPAMEVSGVLPAASATSLQPAAPGQPPPAPMALPIDTSTPAPAPPAPSREKPSNGPTAHTAPQLAEPTPPTPHREESTQDIVTPTLPLWAPLTQEEEEQEELESACEAHIYSLLEKLNWEQALRPLFENGLKEIDISFAFIWPKWRERLLTSLSRGHKPILTEFLGTVAEHARDCHPIIQRCKFCRAGRPLAAIPTSNAAAQVRRNWADITEEVNPGAEEGFTLVEGRKRRRGSANSPKAAAPSSNAGGSRTIRRPQPSAGSVPRAQEIRVTRAHIAEARARQASSSEEHCVYIEHSSELEPFHYLKALDRMLGGTAGVIQITKVNGHQLLGLTNRGLAERLISEGLEVEGTLLRAFPFRKRAERITVGNLPFFVGDSAVINALSPYGRVTSIAPKQMKAGPYVYVDGRRDIFITLHEGITIERLPTRLDINIKGEAWPAYLSSGIRCSRCHGQGHRRAICPLLARLDNNTRMAPPTTPAGVPPPTTPAPPQRSAAQSPAPAPSNPAMEVCSAPPVARAVLHPSAPRPSPPAAPALPMEETPSAPPPVTPAPSLQVPGGPAQRTLGSAAPAPDVEMSNVEETSASSTSSAKNSTRVDLDAFIEKHPSVSFAGTDALGLGREEVLDLLSSRTKAQRKGPLLSPSQCDALASLIGQILDLRPGAASNLYKVLGQVKAELRTTPAAPPTPPLPAPRPAEPTQPAPQRRESAPAMAAPPPPPSAHAKDDPVPDRWKVLKVRIKESMRGPFSNFVLDTSIYVSEIVEEVQCPEKRVSFLAYPSPRQKILLAEFLEAVIEHTQDMDPSIRRGLFVALTRKQRHFATEIGLGLPHPVERMDSSGRRPDGQSKYPPTNQGR